MDTKFIDNLKSTITSHRGLARGNRFSISFPGVAGINPRQLSDLEFFCDTTNMPGRQMLTVDDTMVRQSVKRPNGYANEDVTFSFNLTNDFFIKDIFSKWTNTIVNRDTYEVSYKQDYTIDIFIHQLDQQLKQVYLVKLIDAYPTQVQNVEFSDATTDAVQKLNVTMTYRDFEEYPIDEKYQPTIDPNGGIQPDLKEVKTDRTPSGNIDPNGGIQPDRKATQVDRTPSGNIIPDKGSVQPLPIPISRRIPPTIIPQLPPEVNTARRILGLFGF